jgi:hypothetical protein
MLTLEAPFYEIKNVLVFRDHASSTTFYYLAGPPHLTVDNGNAQFTLLKYRSALDAGGSAAARVREQLGGAFLMIGVDCSIPDDIKDSIESELASQAPDGAKISLVPVLYTHGTAKVVVLDYQPTPAPTGTTGTTVASTPAGAGGTPTRFVRGVIGSATPSLLQDQRAIFSISLDPDAATLIEAAYEADLSPIGVMYELEFSGLRPALSVHATVDMQRCYESFKVGLQIDVTSGTSSDSSKATASDSRTPSTPTTASAPPAQPAPTNPSAPAPAAPTTPTQPAPAVDAAKNPSAPAPSAPVDPANPTGAAKPPPTPSKPAPSPPVQTQPAKAVGPDNKTQPAPPAGQQPSADKKTPDMTSASSNQSTQNVSNSQIAFDADISYMMEKLRQEEAIKIEIVQEQEGKSVDDMLKAAMDMLKEDVIKECFKPAMTIPPTSTASPPRPPASGSAAAPHTQPATASAPTGAAGSNLVASTSDVSKGVTGSDTKVNIGFQLQYRTQDELKTATYDYTAQMPETRTHAPNAFFSALLQKTDKAKHIREIDLDDAFFKVLDVQASTIADFVSIDLKTIAVDLAYGGTADQPRVIKTSTFTPTDTAAKSFQAFLDNDDMSFRNRVSYYFAQSEIGAQRTQYQTDWRTTVSRAVVINPPDDIAMLHVYVEQGVIDWDLIAKVETHITYDDNPNDFHAEQTFLIGPDFTRQQWIVRLTDPAVNTYKVQHTWFLKDGNRQIHGPVQVMKAAQLFVPDPFVQRLTVIIEPEVDPTNVLSIAIDLHYQDPDNQLDIHKFIDLPGPTFKPVTVAIPMMNPSKRDFTYQCTLIKASGSENRPEVETDEPRIIVTEGGLALDVNVQLLGDLAQNGISGLQLDLKSEPLDGQQEKVFSHLFEPGDDKHFVQRLLLRVDRPTHNYQYKTTLYLDSGDPKEIDWESRESSVLVLQPAQLLAAANE